MIDLKLKPVERDGKEIFDTQDGLIVDMNTATNDELPNIEESMLNLYAQSMVLLSTIAKGDLAYDPNFGINAEDVIVSRRTGIEGGFAKNNMLSSLSAIIEDLFENNEEMLMVATAIEANAVIEPSVKE